MRPDDRDVFANEVRSIMNQHFHALRALIFVAKADRAFREAEKRLLALFFKRVAGHRMDTPELEAACMREVRKMPEPTSGQFRYSVRQLVDRLPDYRMAVCATARAMINTDKVPTDAEAEAFFHLIDKLQIDEAFTTPSPTPGER